MNLYSSQVRKIQVVTIVVISLVIGVIGAAINLKLSYSAQSHAPMIQNETNHVYLPLIMGSEARITITSQKPYTTHNSTVKAASNLLMMLRQR